MTISTLSEILRKARNRKRWDGRLGKENPEGTLEKHLVGSVYRAQLARVATSDGA